MDPRPTDVGAEREEAWQRLASEVFDLVIIGGGINGAACARDAVLRGLSVALVERGDLASGTSSRSSKLIHGGVRYLQQGDVGLVLEACRERDLLRTRIAPHLVRAQRFVFPVYADDALPVWQLRAGLLLYDLLAGFRNVETHHMLSPAELLEREPALLADGLEGGAVYYDCWTDDGRLSVETAVAARAGGAVVVNYAELTAFERDGSGRLAAATVEDRFAERRVRVQGRCFVNVAGPWLDRVRRLDDAGAPPRLRVTKGVHAVFDRERVGNHDAIVIRGIDDRVMFAIPWKRHTLVGTTDTDYDGDPAEVSTDRADVDYVLAAVNRAFPAADVTTRDVISTYAGLRPLVAPPDERGASDVSREDEIFESPSGLISLGGGKLTTHRHVAERIVDLAARRIGRDAAACTTAEVPLPAAPGVTAGAALEEEPLDAAAHTRARYGALAVEVDALVEARPTLGEPLVEDLPDLRAEVSHAVEREMAVTVEDVLLRRLDVTLRSRRRNGAVVEEVARVLAEALGWDAARADEEAARYRKLLARYGAGLGGD